jgi:hypothetical protein
MATIVVGGALANKPLSGGEAWVRLSWVLGLRRLGFDVVLLEQLPAGSWKESNLHRSYFREVVAAFGLQDSAALIDGEGPVTEGLGWQEILDAAGEAQLLVNISGHLAAPAVMSLFRRRAYVDIDPGYTQIWRASGSDAARLDGHDVHFTIAENLGTPGCPIPTVGIDWVPTRQPVVLDQWPVAAALDPLRFTTIATWRTPFGRLEHAGHVYPMKLDEFRRLIELPQRCTQRFELALDIHPAERPDLERLDTHGWHVVSARERTGDPGAFRRYVQGSAAEFSVAQGVYVETASGWFSDRTARYLASGKPALVQETGFSRNLPVGEGLVAFGSVEEAAAGAEAIAADYDRHARAARRLAEEHFDSDAILTRFVECATA